MSAIAYFITFSTYGTWLHGDQRGSVDHRNNVVGAPVIAADAELQRARRSVMVDPEYRLSTNDREIVLAAIRQHAEFRGWCLIAVHVRTNHVHIVVRGDEKPDKMMNEFKAYASRALNEKTPGAPKRKHWTRHGSTRWLNTEESLRRAIEYTVDEQGEPMAVHHTRADGTSDSRSVR
jgi:REP element-mobilizing transposase RayT